MKTGLRSLTCSLLIGVAAASHPIPAQAKTPPEVVTPYKAYTAAMSENDNEAAVKHAFAAWQAAERIMGETKTTGDLATNFAMLYPTVMDGRRVTKQTIKAFERAIDLSSFYGEDAGGVELQRRIDYLSWIARQREIASGGYRLGNLEKRIRALGYTGSTFDAERLGLEVQNSYIDKNWRKVQSYGEDSLATFRAADDGVISFLRYLVPIYLAEAYEKQKDPIKAAITYQTLITDLDAHDAHDNQVSGKAYAEWLRLRDEILEDHGDDPRAAIVRDYSVPDGRTAELQPLVRIPPRFPASFARGSKSGAVEVVFDLDTEGRIINPVIVASSSVSLHEPTLDSLKGWRYTPNIAEDKRKGIETKIRFDLASGSGRVLPQGKLKPR